MKTKYLNIINKEALLVGLLLIGSTFSTKSQVTIGTQSPPQKGVLLDLKQSDKPDGSANSVSGLMFTRVYLTDVNNLFPMLSGSERNYDTLLKPQYTDLIVYNVNETAPFQKGLYEWDGTQWNKLSGESALSIKALNGLSLLGSDTVVLGGDLVKNTTINLGDSNLIFNRNQGKIEIGNSDPQAILQIDNPDAMDPLILQNVKDVSEANTYDDPNPMYYNVRISDKGVIRKAIPVVSGKDNESFVFNLTGTTGYISTPNGPIYYTDITSNADTLLTWTKDGVQYKYVTLPEDGTYAFSFRLYGRTDGSNLTNGSFYLTAVKNGTPFYTKEGVIFSYGSSYAVATYTINITVTGAAGDQVGFTMGLIPGGGIAYWRLLQGDVTAANRASMFFWRI